MPRGAAGAVRDAADATSAGTFVVADGTAIPNVSISELLAAHHAQRAAVTVVCHTEPSRNGKPPLQVPSGIYVFNRQALDRVPDRGFCDIKETLIPELHRSGQLVCAFLAPAQIPRVLDGPTYRAVNEWMVEQLVATRTIPDGYVLSGDCLVHRSAVIAREVTLIGPVLVGPGTRIAPRAVLVGPTSIGCDVEIGPGALISRSAVWRRCVVRDEAVVDRCVLPDDVVVAAQAHMFREFIEPVGNSTELAGELAVEPRVNASAERWRRLRRGVFGSAEWSRSPAAQ